MARRDKKGDLSDYLYLVSPQKEISMDAIKKHFFPSVMTAVMTVVLIHIVGMF